MMIFATLIRYRERLNVVPRHGGSRVGKEKNKDQHRHRLAGDMLLVTDYFADDATNTPKEFR
jgi:hypothetical protein